jgi:hypothetical protein
MSFNLIEVRKREEKKRIKVSLEKNERRKRAVNNR